MMTPEILQVSGSVGFATNLYKYLEDRQAIKNQQRHTQTKTNTQTNKQKQTKKKLLYSCCIVRCQFPNHQTISIGSLKGKNLKGKTSPPPAVLDNRYMLKAISLFP